MHRLSWPHVLMIVCVMFPGTVLAPGAVGQAQSTEPAQPAEQAPAAGQAQSTEPAQPAGQAPAAAADRQLVQTVLQQFRELRKYKLDNGLRVYLLPVPQSPVVTVMTAYCVGSADEEKTQTGLSHYLEHLLFKGTDRLMPGDIDRITQRHGGRNNAYTTEDMTVYHFDFAAEHWAIPLEIEADRMRNTRIDAKHEFEQEKGAVVAELDRNEDTPGDLEYKAVLKLLFPPDSPYSHPVIGQREHVRGATAEIIRRHYDNWYHPNNAAIVMVGGFDPQAAMAKIRELFGKVPAADLPSRKRPTFYPPRQGPVRHEFPSKFDTPRMLMGFNTVAVGTPEDVVLDVIERILAGGRTGRLYRLLVEKERLAAAVSAGNYAGRYPGWFAVSLDLLPGQDRGRAEELVLQELETLAREPVRDAELARVRRQILAQFIYAADDVHNLGNAIARAAMYPTGEDVAQFYTTYLNRLLEVTPADVQRVAGQYLQRKQACIVWSVPPQKKNPLSPKNSSDSNNPPPGKQPTYQPDSYPAHPLHHSTRHPSDYSGYHPAHSSVNSPPSHAADGPLPFPRSPRQIPPLAAAPAARSAAPVSLTAARRHVLPNGLTVLLWEQRRLPILYARAEVLDVRLEEPAQQAGVAALTGSLLDEGTARHTGPQIADLIETVGGQLALHASGGSLQVLSPDTDRGLELFFECLTQPAFPEEAFARLKAQQLAAIDDEATQPYLRGLRLFHRLVYGEHPLGRPPLGSRETVEKLTAADCKAFHARTFLPNRTVLVVAGDFDSAAMLQKIETLTRNWIRRDTPPPTVAAPPAPAAGGVHIVSDPQAAQVHVFFGHLGIRRNHPDYHKLLVMDNVLGTGPGFTDRLSAILRDRMGLAYTVRATITASAGRQPGTFMGYVGTFAKSFDDVRRGFLREVERIQAEPPTAEEVENAKRYLLGSMPFRFTTLQGIAGQLLAAETYGLGFEFLEQFRREIAAVTAADVQHVARQYLDPKRMFIVAVGPIDAQGRPLPQK